MAYEKQPIELLKTRKKSSTEDDSVKFSVSLFHHKKQRTNIDSTKRKVKIIRWKSAPNFHWNLTEYIDIMKKSHLFTKLLTDLLKLKVICKTTSNRF